jgi:3-oxoacyl-[acyl-carrier protein] reductase
MDVRGKAAIVTGAGTGVGRATALELARLGCSVLVNYSRSQEGAVRTAAEARDMGVKAVAHRADVSVDADCRAMVQEAIQAFGRLDILVNNAGTTSFIDHNDLEKVTDADWNTILGVNLKGPFNCTRAARPALQAAGGGEVVMTSSVAGLLAIGSSIPYCASKAALNNLTVSLARVLGRDNIRVNAVAPGFIAGEWLQQGLGELYDLVKQAYEKKAALHRVCRPEEVAQAITGIITGPDLVTGHVFPVEGGILIGW